MSAGSVLVVEDDRELATMLRRLLREEGFDVTLAHDGLRGQNLALVRTYDVLVLDRSIPTVDGMTVLATLRRRGITTPVLILSARNELRDRVDGLDAGAADYLGKPFDVEELFARIRALQRRSPRARQVGLPNGSVLDVDRLVVRTGKREVALTDREVLLVQVLAERPGHVLTRADLQARVFPSAGTENVVDTYVSTVRRKLGREIITTVYGVGFRLGP